MAEQEKVSKLIPLDDYLIHQAAETLTEMGHGGREPEWFEHNWYILHPQRTEGVSIEAAFTVHPNQDLIHASAIAVLDNVQYTFRGCRELGHDRTNLAVGPLSDTVIEPLHRWNMRLGENPQVPVSFDLELEDMMMPVVRPSRWEAQDPGLPIKSQVRNVYFPVSVRRGSIRVGGRRFDASGYLGVRDKCWGIRKWVTETSLFLLSSLVWVGRRLMKFTYIDNPDGSVITFGWVAERGGEFVPIVSQKPDLTFKRGTREISRANFTFTDAKGRARTLSAKPLSECMYLGALWLGEKEGDYKGPYRVEGVTYDLSDKETLLKQGLQLINQHVEVSLDGETGDGWIEYLVNPKHPEYGPLR